MQNTAIRQKPHPPKALEALKESLTRTGPLLSADSNIVFVCGAKPSQSLSNGRYRFIQYAEKHFQHSRFFIAEQFFEVFRNRTGSDLLSIEDQLANYSDCIIVILESVGTFTEIGAFAIKDNLAKIILAINDIKFKSSRSFVSLGPIAKIDRHSHFKPTIYADLNSILTAAAEVNLRLSKIEKKNRRRFQINNYYNFNGLKPKIRMYFLLDLITLFQPLSHHELIDILIFLFGQNSFDLHIEIGLLETLNFIFKQNSHLMKTIDEPRMFFDYEGINAISLRSEIINHYHKYSPTRISILRDRIESST